jgi:hypothetical protein
LSKRNLATNNIAKKRNQPKKTKGQKQLALAFTNTLLSSQKTNTHRQQALQGLASGATTPAYSVSFGLVKNFVLTCPSLTVPTRAYPHRDAV